MPRNFALGAQFESFIDDEVRSGRYSDQDAVVREGLRMLRESRLSLRDTKELRRLVEEARREERLVSADDAFDRLERRYAASAER